MNRQERLHDLWMALGMIVAGTVGWGLLLWGWMHCHDGVGEQTMIDACPIAATIMPMLGIPYILCTAVIGLGLQGVWGVIRGSS